MYNETSSVSDKLVVGYLQMGAYRSPQLTQQHNKATNTWDVLNIDQPYRAAGAESAEILKDASIHHSAQ